MALGGSFRKMCLPDGYRFMALTSYPSRQRNNVVEASDLEILTSKGLTAGIISHR
jgi:hypothetical protein